jgi:hypothetical protein
MIYCLSPHIGGYPEGSTFNCLGAVYGWCVTSVYPNLCSALMLTNTPLAAALMPRTSTTISDRVGSLVRPAPPSHISQFDVLTASSSTRNLKRDFGQRQHADGTHPSHSAHMWSISTLVLRLPVGNALSRNLSNETVKETFLLPLPRNVFGAGPDEPPLPTPRLLFGSTSTRERPRRGRRLCE